jgi:hypothetical protein
MGADLSMIMAYPEPIDLTNAGDWQLLAEMIETEQPRFVALDPVVAYIGAQTDLHRANEIRALMAPLAALAAKNGCAIVPVRHLTKARGSRAIYRGLGSIDFSAAARSILLAGSDPEAPSKRALAHIKSNLARLGQTIGYELDAGRFTWGGQSRLTAADLLAEEPTQEDVSALADAAEFLREVLAGTEIPAKEVLRLAREAGISESTLRRAKKQVGVRIRREGFGPGSTVIWALRAP